jgi:hypothetical protein
MEKYERFLSDLFSEIIYVDKNSSFIERTDTFKENGEIKRISRREKINLNERLIVDKDTTNLLVPECRGYGILDLIREKSRSIKLEFYPRNIIHGLFRSKSKIEETFILPKDYFIIASSKVISDINKYVRNRNRIYIIDNCDEFGQTRLDNYIIVGRISRILIDKHLEDLEVSFGVNIGIDYNDFYTISLI